MTPQHIGIVACSAEGAALCYRTICLEGPRFLGTHAHPEVSIHTHSLGEYMQRIYRDDWHGVAELMFSSADKLRALAPISSSARTTRSIRHCRLLRRAHCPGCILQRSSPTRLSRAHSGASD